jgi:Leucine-rich repeat (LRR) protein
MLSHNFYKSSFRYVYRRMRKTLLCTSKRFNIICNQIIKRPIVISDYLPNDNFGKPVFNNGTSILEVSQNKLISYKKKIYKNTVEVYREIIKQQYSPRQFSPRGGYWLGNYECYEIELPNNLKKISKMINCLTFITSIEMTYNKKIFKQIPINILHNLSEVTFKNIHSKSLSKKIYDLINLKCLILNKCYKLKYLPKHIDKLKNLEKLEISGAQCLKCIPKSLCNLRHLDTLQICAKSEFKKLPKHIGNCEKICTLYINGNLKTVPKSIRKIKELNRLILHNNQLEKIPNHIIDLKNLTLLVLNNNKLTKIPRHIYLMDRLRELHVYSNQIVSLPDSIGSLSDLEVLDVGKNKLLSLPSTIQKLDRLRELFISGNNIMSLPRGIKERQPLDEFAKRFTNSLGTLTLPIEYIPINNNSLTKIVIDRNQYVAFTTFHTGIAKHLIRLLVIETG